MKLISCTISGLPHVHSLFWLDEQDQLRTAEDVDRVISAEIPDKDMDQELYGIITRNNVHGPCGKCSSRCPSHCHDHNEKSPCMNNGQCKKRFPKPFQVRLNCMVIPSYQPLIFFCLRMKRISLAKVTQNIEGGITWMKIM